jgi:hypothetical protein
MDSVRGQLFPRMLCRADPRQHSVSRNFASEGVEQRRP